ncbi:hypothetical protein ABIB40_000175 [Pedobacter sp. UYP30]|uniref:polysaccharide lyase beta-sandwich domain-containing protein n=1 Tax=Pedobacter sp. UYP30 TaxID=1756400 RepID=UPI003394B283
MIQILRNNEDLQAVKYLSSNILHVIFYKAGELTINDLHIKVDKPCTLYVKNVDSEKPILHLEDSAQEHANINVELQTAGFKIEKNMSYNLPVVDWADSRPYPIMVK